jgi:hypothetical protein
MTAEGIPLGNTKVDATLIYSLLVFDLFRKMGLGRAMQEAIGARWPNSCWESTYESMGFHQALLEEGLGVHAGYGDNRNSYIRFVKKADRKPCSVVWLQRPEGMKEAA